MLLSLHGMQVKTMADQAAIAVTQRATYHSAEYDRHAAKVSSHAASAEDLLPGCTHLVLLLRLCDIVGLLCSGRLHLLRGTGCAKDAAYACTPSQLC